MRSSLAIILPSLVACAEGEALVASRSSQVQDCIGKFASKLIDHRLEVRPFSNTDLDDTIFGKGQRPVAISAADHHLVRPAHRLVRLVHPWRQPTRHLVSPMLRQASGEQGEQDAILREIEEYRLQQEAQQEALSAVTGNSVVEMMWEIYVQEKNLQNAKKGDSLVVNLLKRSREHGVLSTIGEDGSPTGAVIDFALDHEGFPYVYLTKNAINLNDLQRESKMSLTVFPKEGFKPSAGQRLVFFGNMTKLPEDNEVYERYRANFTETGQEVGAVNRFKVPPSVSSIFRNSSGFYKMDSIYRVEWHDGIRQGDGIPGKEYLDAYRRKMTGERYYGQLGVSPNPFLLVDEEPSPSAATGSRDDGFMKQR